MSDLLVRIYKVMVVIKKKAETIIKQIPRKIM